MIDDHLLAEKLQRFSTDRDWDPFHTPKNIASALSVEASELDVYKRQVDEGVTG